MSKKQKSAGGFSAIIGAIAIVIALLIGVGIYMFIFGNPANFVDGNPENEPIQGNYLGIIHKGGFIVPVLLAVNIIVIIFTIERFVTLSKAKGKGKIDQFVINIKGLLAQKKIKEAMAACDKQQGSLANVVHSGLEKYEVLANDPLLDKEQKIEAIKTELDEATALEMPMLEKNLNVIATLVSIGTLTGLLGTVTGMIKAFSALATGGTPDSAKLANGISEALINTATGIGTSTIAIVMYNILTAKIDKLTYSIDEAGFSIVQTYAANHK